MPRKLLFIVNPNAGKKKSDKIIQTIRKTFPANIYYQFVIWKDKNNFDEIVKLLKSEGYTDAIAVGGDGTVNQVAKNILNSNITLGIIPIGSGNGLARTLGISIDIDQAIKQIVDGQTTTIDSGNVNNIPFFCTSGIGFDAHIGNLFAKSKKKRIKKLYKNHFKRII
jgi:diacylglycerol kinase family enzyme